MEQPVTRAPLPKLGPGIRRAGGETQLGRGPHVEALLCGGELDGESILICGDGTDREKSTVVKAKSMLVKSGYMALLA